MAEDTSTPGTPPGGRDDPPQPAGPPPAAKEEAPAEPSREEKIAAARARAEALKAQRAAGPAPAGPGGTAAKPAPAVKAWATTENAGAQPVSPPPHPKVEALGTITSASSWEGSGCTGIRSEAPGSWTTATTPRPPRGSGPRGTRWRAATTWAAPWTSGSPSGGAGPSSARISEDEHGVAEAREPVPPADRLRVSLQDALASREGAHEEEGGRPRQVEVGDEGIGHPEGEARRDEELGPPAPRLDGLPIGGRRLEGPHARRPHHDDPSPLPARCGDGAGRLRSHLVVLRLHPMAAHILALHRTEGARSHVQRDGHHRDATAAELVQQAGGEVQARRGRRDGPVPLRVHGLVVAGVPQGRLDVGRHRDLADALQDLAELPAVLQVEEPRAPGRPRADPGPQDPVREDEAGPRPHAPAWPEERFPRPGGPRVVGPDEQRLDPSSGVPAPPQAHRQDPGVVDDQHVARSEVLGEVAEDPVLQGPPRAVEHQEPGAVPGPRRGLRDQVSRQLVVELREVHAPPSHETIPRRPGQDPPGGIARRPGTSSLLGWGGGPCDWRGFTTSRPSPPTRRGTSTSTRACWACGSSRRRSTRTIPPSTTCSTRTTWGAPGRTSPSSSTPASGEDARGPGWSTASSGAWPRRTRSCSGSSGCAGRDSR